MSRRARSRWRLLVTPLVAGVAFACASGESAERQSPSTPLEEPGGAEAVPSDAEDSAESPSAPSTEPTRPVDEGVLAERGESASPDLLWPMRVLEGALAPPPPPPAPAPLPENPWYATHQFARVRLMPRTDDATVAHLIDLAERSAHIDAGALRVEGALAALGASYPSPEAGALFSVEAELAPLPFDRNLTLLTVGIHTARAPESVRPLVVMVDASRRSSAGDLAAARAAVLSLEGSAESVFALHEGLVRVQSLDDDAGRPRGAFDLAQGLSDVVAGLAGPRDILVLSSGPERNRIEAMGEACANAARRGHRVFMAGAPAPGLPAPVLEDLARRGDGRAFHIDTSATKKPNLGTQMARARTALLGHGVLEARFEPELVHGYRLLGYTRGPAAAAAEDRGASVAADADITLVFALALTGAGQRALLDDDPLTLGDIALSGVHEDGKRALDVRALAARAHGELAEASPAMRDVAAVAAAFQKARGDPAFARLSFAEIQSLANPRSPRATRVEQLLDLAERAR